MKRQNTQLSLAAFVGLTAAFALACGGSSVKSDPAPNVDEARPAAAMSESEVSLKAAMASYDAIGRRDMKALGALLTDEFVQTDVDGVGETTGANREQYLAFWTMVTGVAPNLKNTQLVTVANGRRSASLYLFDPAVPTNRMAVILAEVSAHDAEGRITGIREYGDPLTMLAQSGFLADAERPGPEAVWPERFSVAATGSAAEEANIEVVRKLFAADAAGSSANVMSLLTADVHLRALPFKSPAIGKEAVLALMSNRHKALDASYDELSLWGAGEWVVAESKTTLKFKVGPHAGKELTHHLLGFVRVQNGAVSHLYYLWNEAHNKVALGDLTEAEFVESQKRFREAFAPKAAGAEKAQP